MKKGAALLIGLLIIAALGTIALTVGRSVISGLGFTTALSDAIIADQASLGGIEWGLLQDRNSPGWTGSARINLDAPAGTDPVTIPAPAIAPPPTQRTADITISGATPNKEIRSVGRFGGISKRHRLYQVP